MQRKVYPKNTRLPRKDRNGFKGSSFTNRGKWLFATKSKFHWLHHPRCHHTKPHQAIRSNWYGKKMQTISSHSRLTSIYSSVKLQRHAWTWLTCTCKLTIYCISNKIETPLKYNNFYTRRGYHPSVIYNRRFSALGVPNGWIIQITPT